MPLKVIYLSIQQFQILVPDNVLIKLIYSNRIYSFRIAVSLVSVSKHTYRSRDKLS